MMGWGRRIRLGEGERTAHEGSSPKFWAVDRLIRVLAIERAVENFILMDGVGWDCFLFVWLFVGLFVVV